MAKTRALLTHYTIEIGWHRDGYEICYYQNYMKRKNAGYYYTLTFTIKFKCTYLHDTFADLHG